MFELGDEVIVNGQYEDKVFDDTTAVIYRIEGDSRYILLYMPDWVTIGHNDALREWESGRAGALPNPGRRGSWNVPRKWLENGNIQLASSCATRHPNWKVIKKIEQMKQRRTEMGYAF